jgi:hypothetical protein
MGELLMFRLTTARNLGFILLAALIAAPVAAHTVGVSEDETVAATFHITPNDNPKAKQSSHAWFALTDHDGHLIPLSQCNCRLSVYLQPRSQNPQPVRKPTLKEISVEGYGRIPGADIVFPRAGAYDLVLRGTAKNGADFPPFTLTFTVNVGS